MSEVVKICNKHGDLTIEDLKTGVYRGKKYRKCKKCELQRSREYCKKIYEDSIKHINKKDKDKKYWSENKEKIKERRLKNNDCEKRREQCKRLAPRYRETWNSKQKEYRHQLHDSYVRRIIQDGNKDIPLMSIPQSMIKLKRAIMMAKKGIKNKLKENL